MRASDIERVLIGWFFPRNIFVPNIYLNGEECDLFMLAPSGRTTDFEIKVSRSDFFADAKKFKHTRYGNAFKSRTSKLPCFGEKCLVPNHFIYVLPDEIGITAVDVPTYAGLWTITQNERHGWAKRIMRVKKAPIIHRERLDVLEKMARSLWVRYAQKVILYPTTEPPCP